MEAPAHAIHRKPEPVGWAELFAKPIIGCRIAGCQRVRPSDVIWGEREAEIFLQMGLDGQFADLPVGQKSAGWISPAYPAASELEGSVVEHPSLLPIASKNVCCSAID